MRHSAASSRAARIIAVTAGRCNTKAEWGFSSRGASLYGRGGDVTIGEDARACYDPAPQRHCEVDLLRLLGVLAAGALLTPTGAAALVKRLVGHNRTKPFWNYTVEHKKNPPGG